MSRYLLYSDVNRLCLIRSGYSNWSYFSALSYMKGFFAESIFGAPYTTTFCDPIYTCLFVTERIYGLLLCSYKCAFEKKMVPYLRKNPQSRKDRKYTWQKTARRSRCHNFETNGRPIINVHMQRQQPPKEKQQDKITTSKHRPSARGPQW